MVLHFEMTWFFFIWIVVMVITLPISGLIHEFLKRKIYLSNSHGQTLENPNQKLYNFLFTDGSYIDLYFIEYQSLSLWVNHDQTKNVSNWWTAQEIKSLFFNLLKINNCSTLEWQEFVILITSYFNYFDFTVL